MRLCASGAKSTPGGPQPSLAANYDSQQAPLPGRLFQPRAHALADVAPGTRRRGAAGKWPWLLDPAEPRAREPEWRTEPAVGSGGGDGADRAGMAAAAAAGSLGEAVALGSGRGRHVRPTLGSALPAPGPRGTCVELPPNPGVGACVPGRRGPGGRRGGSGAVPVPSPRSPPKGAGSEGATQWACAAGTTLRGCKSGGQPAARAGHRRDGGCAAPILWALHLCECGVGKGCFISVLLETLL